MSGHSHSTHSSFDVDIDDLNIGSLKHELCGVKLPDLSRVIPSIQNTRRPPKILRALHRLRTHCSEKHVSAVDKYATIRRVEVLLQNHLPPGGHGDGGVMTS